MTNKELSENYIYACTKRLPRRQREDIGKELSGLIDDMLSDRCGDLTPSAKDMHIVLTEIGTPTEVYTRYTPSAQRALIESPYYIHYLFVIKIVLPCVAFGITLAHFIMLLAGDLTFGFGGLSRWLAALVQSEILSFTIVTLLFSFFSYRKTPMFQFISPEDLPSAPKKSHDISRAESAISIVASIFFAVIILGFPQIISIYRDGSVTPIFNIEILRSKWLWVALLCLANIGADVMGIIDRRYTLRVTLANIGTCGISILCAMMIFADTRLVNTALSALPYFNDFANFFILHFEVFILFIIVLSSLVEIGMSVYKYKMEKKRSMVQ